MGRDKYIASNKISVWQNAGLEVGQGASYQTRHACVHTLACQAFLRLSSDDQLALLPEWDQQLCSSHAALVLKGRHLQAKFGVDVVPESFAEPEPV